MMGLASYGEPAYLEEMRRIVHSDGRLGFTLDLSYFRHHSEGVDMTWASGSPTLGMLYSDKLATTLGPTRLAEEPIEKRHQDVAASAQALLEETMFTMINRLHEKTGEKALCMAGGVALNCSVNGKILGRTPFEDIYIQAASSDAGTAVGAAFYVWHQVLGHERSFVMDHAYWGPGFDDTECEKALRDAGLAPQKLDEETLVRRVARRVAAGEVVGWFQGRMEFGPRALGNRSIVADPRRPEMKDVLNARIKFREPFRPFAPSILEEKTSEYFECSYPSPFMLMTYRVRPSKREEIPATTHVDGTGRLQTVSRKTNPLYWKLIKAFEVETGVPVLLNTSFNENEPIVCRPQEAVDCFLRTHMDALALGPFLAVKRGAQVRDAYPHSDARAAGAQRP